MNRRGFLRGLASLAALAPLAFRRVGEVEAEQGRWRLEPTPYLVWPFASIHGPGYSVGLPVELIKTRSVGPTEVYPNYVVVIRG